ncbi:MAG TPA: RodZ domain-containing protein [Thermoanaerobaculia bacterium]
MANQYGSESEPSIEERHERASEEAGAAIGSSEGEAVPGHGEQPPPFEGGAEDEVVVATDDGDDTVELPSPAQPRRSGAVAGAAAAAAVPPGGTVPRGPASPGSASLGEASFGTWLRRQRELREIDLREIAEKTKISLRYLKAMEQDRFEVLPAPVFARGFLREYAKYVGLNADEVVNYYLSTHAGEGVEELAREEAVDPGRSRGPVTRGAFLVILLIVAVAVLAYFLFWRQSQEDARRAAPPPIAPPASELAVPAEAPPPPPEPALAAPIVVTLDLTQECWVEARVDGAPELSRLFVAGESIQLEAEDSVELTLGNGGGVEVQVNNMPYDLGVASGQVANVTIDLSTVERLRQRVG